MCRNKDVQTWRGIPRVERFQRTRLTDQTLVNDAEHEHIMKKDVIWVFGTEGDMGDGRVPLQPEAVKSYSL